ncbi:MAG: phosphate/phosphite/phosphonate ABC transporter substrate-binding protein [Candidatus Thiodiazotropha taylori]|nr:phosphate/phosphite/phosphonate ABC transporter substrate-binding protein [Candidatus Thiodiazotropha taylori]MCG8069848.1 phosphate/phosphite/phosphonate ABC transporter substrate-binding protein [Candidatus Thiodiazotropha taylori]
MRHITVNTHRALPCLLGMILGLFLNGCGDAGGPGKIDLDDVATTEEIAQVLDNSPGKQVEEYLFGFDLRNGPREDARQYLPLLDYLSRHTDFRFRLHFSKDAKGLLKDLVSGRLHFAAIGAGTYLTAQGDTAIEPLVRGVNAKGEHGYRSIIIVAPDSPLRGLADLKGKRVAFGSRTSTQGYWIPRIMFDNAGISLADFAGHFFTGSHRDCAEAVLTGGADACGLQDTMAERLIESGAVRALAASEIFPSSGIFSGTGVPVGVREAVREALIAFKPQGGDRDGLYHWERTEMAGGFISASVDDYTELRNQANHLGLLPDDSRSNTKR